MLRSILIALILTLAIAYQCSAATYYRYDQSPQIVTPDVAKGFILFGQYSYIGNEMVVCPARFGEYENGHFRCGNDNAAWRYITRAIPANTKYVGFSILGDKSIIVYYK